MTRRRAPARRATRAERLVFRLGDMTVRLIAASYRRRELATQVLREATDERRTVR